MSLFHVHRVWPRSSYLKNKYSHSRSGGICWCDIISQTAGEVQFAPLNFGIWSSSVLLFLLFLQFWHSAHNHFWEHSGFLGFKEEEEQTPHPGSSKGVSSRRSSLAKPSLLTMEENQSAETPSSPGQRKSHIQRGILWGILLEPGGWLGSALR